MLAVNPNISALNNYNKTNTFKVADKNIFWFCINNDDFAVPYAEKNEQSNSKYISIIKIIGQHNNVPGSIADTAFIMFIQGATTGFDPDYDISKILIYDPGMPNIFSVISGSVYAVLNALPELDTVMVVVPLGYSVNSNVQQKISAVSIVDFPLGTSIYLEDVQQSHIQNLTVNPTYVFNMQTTDPPTGRFFLKFDAPNIVGINENTIEPVINIQYNENQLFINIVDEKNSTGFYDIIDIFGRTIKPSSIVYPGKHQIEFSNVNSGYYFVRFNYDGKTIVKKFFVN